MNNKIILAALIIMIILNGAALFMLFNKKDCSRSGKPSKTEMKGSLEEDLNLNEEQATTFKALQNDHFEGMKMLNKELHETKQSIMASLASNEMSDSALQIELNHIGDLHVEMERNIYEHFRQLKQICNDEQIQLYNDFIMRVSERIKGPEHGPPPHGPGHGPGPPPHRPH